ncbi:MAG: exodeoxyribonuclease III [Burkholderiaceae bacterium]|jgi:exodeoxyribonuclease-3|nr:exodeoxyribonuclease III [Burkholderiaceae bacterium]
MKIATWNVNSIRTRLSHVLRWLDTSQVDVLCLQETKILDAQFPRAVFEEAGYLSAYSGQKMYNGVAILSRHPMLEVTSDNPFFPDEQRRILAATVAGIRLVCVYVPNGQSLESDKYAYKLNWLGAFCQWMAEECNTHTDVAILGDYNIAPEDRDVCEPEKWQGHVLASDAERTAFGRLTQMGFKDAFRLFHEEGAHYSWWDYRQRSFQRNAGLRLDHVLLSSPLAERCLSCTIDRTPRQWEKPSDHAPVIVEVDV